MTRKRLESLNHDELMALICICGEHDCIPKDIGDIEIKENRRFIWSWKFPFLKIKKTRTAIATFVKPLNYIFIEGKISI